MTRQDKKRTHTALKKRNEHNKIVSFPPKVLHIHTVLQCQLPGRFQTMRHDHFLQNQPYFRDVILNVKQMKPIVKRIYSHAW